MSETAEGIAEAGSASCEHVYASTHQPGLPVYWIRQCSLCRAFDAEDLTEQVRQLTEAAAVVAVERAFAAAREELAKPLAEAGREAALHGMAAERERIRALAIERHALYLAAGVPDDGEPSGLMPFADLITEPAQ
jgi:hypothetical protein